LKHGQVGDEDDAFTGPYPLVPAAFAISVGWAPEDPTFFRRLFKRTTGMTPAAYRRKYAAIVAVV